MATLCQKLNISATDSEQLAHACVPYLSMDQPEQLQRACHASLTTLVQRDPDSMWLLLQQLWVQEATPPHPTLKPYKVHIMFSLVRLWLFRTMVDGDTS